MSAEKTTPENIPDHVIEAILNHIPFDGWSTASLNMAAADCGLSGAEMHSQFPAGITDAIYAYGAYADKNMITAFPGQDAADIAAMPVHMKIRSLILIRLEQATPYKEVVRRTLAILARPQRKNWLPIFYTEQLMRCGVQQGIPQQIIISTPNGRLYRLFTVPRCWPFYLTILLIWRRHKHFWTGGWRMWLGYQRWHGLREIMADMAVRFGSRAAERFAGPIMRGRSALDFVAVLMDL